MNTDLKFKLLQYLNQKKQSSGFNFVEVLMTIILLGLFSLFFIYYTDSCLPGGRCGNHGKQPEARTYVGTLNVGQIAYYKEKSTFSTDVSSLEVGIRTASINYNYHVKVINKGTNSVAINYSTTTDAGAGLKNYVGFVSLIPNKDNPKEVPIQAILCEQKTAGEPASFNIEWKVGIEPPKCNQSQVQVGGTY